MKYEGYTVTTDGKVFGKRGKEMKSWDNGKGYLILGLMINGKRIIKAVHRLVAEVHLPNPNNLPEVDHINDIRDDNRLENLMWVTKEQNVQKSYDTGDKTSTGIKNGRCLVTENIVRDICILIASGLSAAQIRDRGFDYSLVRKIKNKQNWTSISKYYF